jgi:hypothetical protein
MTACIGAGLLALVVLVVLHGVNTALLGDGVVLGLDRDYSVAFFWTVLIFAAAAVVWGRLAAVRPEGRGIWIAMCVLCAALAVEGLVQIHGRLEDSTGYDLQMLIVQPLIAIAVIALFVVCYRRLPAPERYLLAAAVACLVLAQFWSTVNGQLDLPHAGIVVASVLEESFEMLTGVLLLAAPLGLALRLPSWSRPDLALGRVEIARAPRHQPEGRLSKSPGA